MNNDSEKTDNTMNNDSEKIDKTWKKGVAWFLLPLTLLVSVLILILIVDTWWYPKPLKLPEIFIKYKQIITVITLLASVSLLSFLTQIYRNKDPEKIPKIWKIIAYPIHWAFRLAARSLLLVLLMSVLLSVPILFLIVKTWHPELLVFLKNKQIITIITLLASAGMLSSLLLKSLKDIGKSLLNIIKKIIKILWRRWLPGLDIKESMSVTWQHYGAKIWPSLVEIFTETRRLVFALSLSYIVFSLIYLIQEADTERTQATEDWRKNVTTKLDSIKKEIADHSHPIVQPEPPISYPLEKGTQFPVFYLSQGDLDTKKGICPADSNLVEWLTSFKQAISKCPENNQVKLQIRAFASTAPVTKKGHPSFEKETSDTFNYQIANERAEALIYFLTLDDPKSYTLGKCKDALKDSLISKRTPSDSIWGGQGFTVTYTPWRSHLQMTNAKLMKDGTLDERRRDLEFLNRSVQIIIEEGGCLTK